MLQCHQSPCREWKLQITDIGEWAYSIFNPRKRPQHGLAVEICRDVDMTKWTYLKIKSVKLVHHDLCPLRQSNIIRRVVGVIGLFIDPR